MRQLGELTAADVMSERVICIDDSARVTEAIRKMDEERVSVLPVVDAQNNVVGILSASDLISITHEIQADLGALFYVNEASQEFLIKQLIAQGDSTFVRDVMTAPVKSIKPDTNLVVAARELIEYQYHHLPVVDETGRAVGIISTTDFVRAFAEQGGLLAG